jgi:hypothetical protein
MEDPGNGKTIEIDSENFCVMSLTSTGAETRTLAAPNRPGIFFSAMMIADGGDISFTVTGTYDGTNSVITFDQIEDWVVFYSVETAPGVFRWRAGFAGGTALGMVQTISTLATTTATFSDLTVTGSAALSGAVRPRGWNELPARYELKWVAGARGLPQLTGVTQEPASNTYATASFLASIGADRQFEILGTNASSDDVTISAEGGIKVETDGGANDQVILAPHLTNTTAWRQVTWGSDQQTEWSCHIKTGTAITATTIWAGLKLTNTLTMATDADQAYFMYAPATNSGKWEAIYSIANTDVAANTGITVAVDTEYHLRIVINAARVPTFYINGVLVATGTALTTAKDFIPYIGIEGQGAAKHMYVYGQAISRAVA